MIVLYTGTPGSGKSLHAAYQLIDYLYSGFNVIGNFPIDAGYFKKRPKGTYYYCENKNLTVKNLKQFAKEHHVAFKEHQTLLIIDECGMLFNPRAWNNSDRMDWLTFFSQHRKLGYEILLIAQMDKQLDKQILGQIEEEHKHRSVRNYKWFGKLLSFITGGLFLDITYWYPCRLKIGSSFFRYSPRKAKLYDTYQLFE
ncbi:MAG: zonular occludens toxin domain-containing protein [Oscillospiraceae bacterium]